MGQHTSSRPIRHWAATAALVSIAASMTACGGGHSQSPAEQLANSAHDRMAKLCTVETFMNLADASDHPTAAVKAVGYTDDGSKEGFSELGSWHYIAVPSVIEATDEGSVHSVVCNRSVGKQAGGCSNGQWAITQGDDIYILSWPDGKLTAYKEFYGEPPNPGRDCMGSEPKRDEINAWLQQVIR
jgi:hypothetical protein